MIGNPADPDPGVEDPTVRSPPAVFELLADESRFDILRALREASASPVGYSELRRRANIDDSGRFNYHLMRLTDTLVADVEGGYELRREAEGLLDAVLASSLVGDPADRYAGRPADDRGPSAGTESDRYSNHPDRGGRPPTDP